jgi:hypothetical protein
MKSRSIDETCVCVEINVPADHTLHFHRVARRLEERDRNGKPTPELVAARCLARLASLLECTGKPSTRIVVNLHHSEWRQLASAFESEGFNAVNADAKAELYSWSHAFCSAASLVVVPANDPAAEKVRIIGRKG